MTAARPTQPKRAWWLAIALVAAIFAAPGGRPLAAEPDVHGDWVVQCTEADRQGPQCQMSQTLTAEGTGEHVMTLVLRRPDGGGAGMTGLVRLPHGLDLPAGIALDVDGGSAPLRSAIQTSDAAGVYARLPLGETMVAALKAGRTLNVSMRSVKGEAITLGVSLAGFTAAAQALAAVGEARP